MTGDLSVIIWGVTGRWPWIGVIAMALLCAALSIAIYARQARVVPRGWWVMMLVLRMAALIAICLSLLQPMAVRPQLPDEDGGVAILIDRSRSMSAIDTGESPAELVATAAALKLFPTDLRDEKSLDLRRQIEQLNSLLSETRRLLAEQQYARLTSHPNDGSSNEMRNLQSRWRKATAVMTGEPIASPLADLANGIEQPGWSEQAEGKINAALAHLAAGQSEADAKLYQQNDVVREACAKLKSMTRLERARAATDQLIAQIPPSVPIYGTFFDSTMTPAVLRQGGNLSWPKDISTAGDQSDINGAIRELYARMGNNHLRAVLLLTDGRQVGGTLGSFSAQSSTPIFPVLCAGTPRDLVLSKITAPRSAYLDEPIHVAAQIRSTNLADFPLQIVLQNGNLTQTQILHLDHAGSATANFIVPIAHSGEQSISVSLPAIPGEASDQNNRGGVGIAIEKQRIKLALLASFPSRDFQFLRQELKETSWIESTIIGAGENIAAQELEAQQVIILDDLAARQLDAAQWSAIRESTERNSAGLILIAGPNHLPAEYLADPHLAALLPFDASTGQAVWRTWAGADAYFRFQPVDVESPLLRLEDETTDVMYQWDRLPAMYHYLQMPAPRPEVEPLLLERESGSPVLTQMRFGAGRIIFAGCNETWRWRSLSLAMQQRFWLQLFRHAAPLSDRLQQKLQPAEISDLSPESSVLSRLAASSTGEIYSLADTSDLWKKIRAYEQSHPGVTEYPLWHSPWFFAFILGCFGTEWSLRKRFGLA